LHEEVATAAVCAAKRTTERYFRTGILFCCDFFNCCGDCGGRRFVRFSWSRLLTDDQRCSAAAKSKVPRIILAAAVALDSGTRLSACCALPNYGSRGAAFHLKRKPSHPQGRREVIAGIKLLQSSAKKLLSKLLVLTFTAAQRNSCQP